MTGRSTASSHPAPLLLLLLLLLGPPSPANAGCTIFNSTCYADPNGGSGRLIGPGDSPSIALTLEYCAQLCANKKMPLAGAEYGGQCYCGAKFNYKPTRSSACNQRCTADDKETCGGTYAINVFTYKCSGAPVPAPPPLPPPPPPTPPPPPCSRFNEQGCAELFNPCLNTSLPYHAMPFCDETKSLDERAADMVSRMTLGEKIGMLDTGGPAIAGLGLPAYNWWSEASSGVANEINHRGQATETTKFAFPITTGMSFNRTLWLLTGRQIGREARAMMNVGTGFSTFWAPVINLAREPRWGRNIETPGEDPYLTGEYAEYFTKGMQESPDAPGLIMASACCKHYVANSMEGTTQADGEQHDRQHVDSLVTQQDLIDSYMAPFQACVEKGKVSGLMCSYNSVNGVPSCANDWLLKDVARGEWGFDGYVTSDCDADGDVFGSHSYRNQTAEEDVRDILRAGTDVDCGGFIGGHAQSALNNGTITLKDIHARLVNLFKVRLRLGHFSQLNPLDEIPASEICSPYAIETSMAGPIQSSALLKNDGNTLPFSAGQSGSFAVLGPNANLSESDSGYYGPHNCCGKKYWNVVDAVAKYAAGGVTTALGVPSPLSSDTSHIPAAVALAKAADNVVVAVGTDLSWSAEGHDAKNISFTDAQLQLIEQCATAAKKPIVVVLLTATPLDISSLLANPKVGAILHTGQPSVTVLGIAELLYGKVSPAGRMIQTIYPASYQDQISIFDFNMRPGPSPFVRPDCAVKCPNYVKSPWNPMMHGGPCGDCKMGTNPGRTHRFYTGKPVVPFGYGLSYTTFKYAVVAAPSHDVSLADVRAMLATTKAAGRTFPSSQLLAEAAPLVNYTVSVTNTGSMDADDVILGFLTPPGAGTNGVPLQSLFGFERVHVPAGATVTVNLYPSLTDFTVVDRTGERRVHPGQYKFHFGVEEAVPHGQGYAQHFVTTY